MVVVFPSSGEEAAAACPSSGGAAAVHEVGESGTATRGEEACRTVEKMRDTNHAARCRSSCIARSNASATITATAASSGEDRLPVKRWTLQW